MLDNIWLTHQTHRDNRDGRRATTAEGAADHRRQNLHQRRINESVLSQHRRQINDLLVDIDGTKVQSRAVGRATRSLVEVYRSHGGLGND